MSPMTLSTNGMTTLSTSYPTSSTTTTVDTSLVIAGIVRISMGRVTIMRFVASHGAVERWP
jgi:cytochrome c biogenesis protein CcdA